MPPGPKRLKKTMAKKPTRYRTNKVYRNRFSQGPPGLGIQKNFVNAGTGFPKRLMMKHRYSETFTMTSTTGSLANYLFKCNGMYDPNQTGTGHQPYWFDQLTAVYSYYCVVGSRINVTITHSGSGTSPGWTCTLTINEDATVAATDMRALRETTESKYVTLPYTSTDAKYLNSSWSLKKRYGTTSKTDLDFRGNAGADPTEKNYYVISAQPTDRLSSGTILVEAVIEYIAIWTDIKDNDGS